MDWYILSASFISFYRARLFLSLYLNFVYGMRKNFKPKHNELAIKISANEFHVAKHTNQAIV